MGNGMARRIRLQSCYGSGGGMVVVVDIGVGDVVVGSIDDPIVQVVGYGYGIDSCHCGGYEPIG